MSDYNRNAAVSPFGRAADRSRVAVDEGLRAYMLHVYNYMVIGLAITGLAALGIYMASVTADPGAAFKKFSATASRFRPASPATCTSRRSAIRSS